MTSSSSPPDRRPAAGHGRRRPRRPGALREAGVSPTKALGQHFLTDRRTAWRIVDAAGLSGTETAIEVGPGLGALTEGLAERAGRLVALEVDPALVRRLRERFGGAANVTVVEADVLTLEPAALLASLGLESDYVVVANLPYNIGAAVLRHFLESSTPPRRLVVMLQREVADAIVAGPGAMSLVGIGVQAYAEARRLFSVPPGVFFPPPKVHSAVLRLDVRPEPLVPPEERAWFFEVARAGFSAPRKQLRNALANGLRRPARDVETAVRECGIDPTVRPQELGVLEWLALARRLREAA